MTGTVSTVGRRALGRRREQRQAHEGGGRLGAGTRGVVRELRTRRAPRARARAPRPARGSPRRPRGARPSTASRGDARRAFPSPAAASPPSTTTTGKRSGPFSRNASPSDHRHHEREPEDPEDHAGLAHEARGDATSHSSRSWDGGRTNVGSRGAHRRRPPPAAPAPRPARTCAPSRRGRRPRASRGASRDGRAGSRPGRRRRGSRAASARSRDTTSAHARPRRTGTRRRPRPPASTVSGTGGSATSSTTSSPPTWATSSAGVPAAATRPRSTIAIRSQRRSASSM